MIIIDGAYGEGGGQIFRTSLTMAMCLNTPVQIKAIRAGRRKPGLLRQHLACLRAAQTLCSAEVIGDSLGSTEVTFVPGEVQPGQYHFAIGSAGSTSLLFQTILMPLLLSKAPGEIHLEGGTHNDMAPSFDFIQLSFLPIVQRMGYRVTTQLLRHGFNPSGGGTWTAITAPTTPTQFKPIHLCSRGKLTAQQAVATSANIPEHINQRELNYLHKQCQWPRSQLFSEQVEADGPGNIISLRLQGEEVTEVIEVVGARGISAERVTGKAIAEMKRYLGSTAAIGEHLADQLLLPMLFAQGGQFTTLNPSEHLRTNIAVIKLLSGVEILLQQCAEELWRVEVPALTAMPHGKPPE